jgi:four helix bundle protein
MDKKENIIRDKSYQFAIKIIHLYKKMSGQNEFILSKQLLRSGTSIGANVEEASAAQSRKDFLSKMSIASKEARETNYWLRIIRDSNLYEKTVLSDIIDESNQLIRMLTSIVKTTKKNL